jgi:uncharacterized delta-60 repeat protein
LYVARAGPAIVQQSDGRVLVARTDWAGSDGMDSEVAVARLLHDGTLDPEFGIGGFVRLRFRGAEAAGVGGLALVRTDGSLDPGGFGNGGRLALDLPAAGRSDYAVATVALEDGRIIVAGTADSNSGTRFFMVRMTTQGNLDPSFGERDGFAWAGSITQPSGFHRTASGQFVACGTWLPSSAPEGRIARFDSAGDLVGETSLASAGIEYLNACAPGKDGSVVFGGYGQAGTWLGRVGVDGGLDSAVCRRTISTLGCRTHALESCQSRRVED